MGASRPPPRDVATEKKRKMYHKSYMGTCKDFSSGQGVQSLYRNLSIPTPIQPEKKGKNCYFSISSFCFFFFFLDPVDLF